MNRKIDIGSRSKLVKTTECRLIKSNSSQRFNIFKQIPSNKRLYTSDRITFHWLMKTSICT